MRLPSYLKCTLHVFWHDGDPPRMDHTQVYILKQSDAERFHRFLNSQQRSHLKMLRSEMWIGLTYLNPAELPLQGAGMAPCG